MPLDVHRQTAIEVLREHLRESPDDYQSWLVFADRLLDEGDLRGQLIPLEIASRSPGLKEPQRKEIARQIVRLRWEERIRSLDRLETPPGLELIWRFGFVEGMILHADVLGAALRIAKRERERFFSSFSARVPFREGAIDAIAEEIVPSLRSLSLADAALSDRGVGILARRGLRRLKTVRLQRAQIASEGARIFADAIGEPHEIVLNGNPLGDEGVLALARSGKLAEVRHLHLTGVGMSDTSAAVLIQEALSEELEYLVLRDNPIGDATARAIVRAGLRSLASIDVSETDLTRNGISSLANRERLPALESIVFRGVQIGDAGMIASFLRHLRERGIVGYH